MRTGPGPGRGGRRAAGVRWTLAAGVVLIAALAAAAPAVASYVFYYRTFGDWSVTCWSDRASGNKACSLSAPPPVLEDTIPRGRSRSLVTVTEAPAGAFVVTVRVPGVLVPGSPVFLRVDKSAPHEARPDGRGVAAWGGTEAADIVAELKAGRRLGLRSFPLGGKAPRDEAFSAEGFAEALAVYRRHLRTHGIIAAAAQEIEPWRVRARSAGASGPAPPAGR